MNKKKTWGPLVFIIAFLTFLYLGIQVGKALFGHVDPAPTSIEEVSYQLPLAENKFLLIIQVENLNTEKAYLEGVWLVNFQTQEPALSFFPLLPSQSDNGVEHDEELASAFSLDDKNQPAQEFFNILSKRNLSWQGYIIIDQWAIAEITTFLGGVDLGDGQREGFQVIDKLHFRSQDRLLARHDQALLLKGICFRSAEISKETSLFQLLNVLTRHLSMGGISPSFWEEEWRSMKETGNITCQTPTLPDLTVK